MKKVLIALFATAALLTAAPAHGAISDPRAHSGEVSNTPDSSIRVGNHTAYRKSVFWVGDSITNLMWSHKMRTLRPGWEISSVPGRDVSTLPYYTRDRCANPHPVRLVIVALGTNATQGWTEADYRAAIRCFGSTPVIFVTSYRNPRLWPNTLDYRRRASASWLNARSMARVAASRPHTCVMQWRSWVSQHPAALHDGVHPNMTGVNQYAAMITQTAKKCLAR